MNRFFPNYDTYKITSRFGMRTLKGVTKMHKGIDLVARAPDGGSMFDVITAHSAGIVTGCGYDASAGNFIKIQTAPGVIMVYYHMVTKPKFQKGDAVLKGDTIGCMGATGNVTGAHLHFGICDNGTWVDPEPYLDRDYENAGTEKETQYVSVSLPVLERGDKSDVVRAMQSLLIGRGCSCGASGVDGSFGPATAKALNRYQAANDIPEREVCAAEEWAALLGVK